tara:strand:- start:10145 stop:10762 length:618 start_codon:yes stop_codon:yes gene_type:complete
MTDFLPNVEMPEPVELETTPEPAAEPVENDEESVEEVSALREPVEDEMFEPPTKNIEVKVEEEEDFEEPVVQEVKKIKKQRKPPSKKQLESLARTRAKRSAEVKARKDKQRREKEEGERLLQEKREEQKKPVVVDYQADIQKAIERALETQETKRKERKALKKIKQAEEKVVREQKEKLTRTISNAVSGGYNPHSDPYANCFNFH